MAQFLGIRAQVDILEGAGVGRAHEISSILHHHWLIILSSFCLCPLHDNPLVVIKALHSLLFHLRLLHCEQANFVVQCVTYIGRVFTHSGPRQGLIKGLLSFRNLVYLLLNELASLL